MVQALVVRFGGSSLDTPVRMRNAAERIREHRVAGAAVIVVVGASVHQTSRIYSWLDRLRHSPECGVAREVDCASAAAEQVTASLVAATIASAGVPAVSLGAEAAGLRGDGDYGGGVLRSVDAGLIGELLAGGSVVVLPGGHVHRPDGEIVSLGRLGAYVTAVALAAALGACCHFVVDRRRLDLAKESEPLIHPEALRCAVERSVPIQAYSFRRSSVEPDTVGNSS